MRRPTSMPPPAASSPARLVSRARSVPPVRAPLSVDQVYDTVQTRVVEKVKALRQGAPDLGPDIHQGPVSDKNAMQKILDYSRSARRKASCCAAARRASRRKAATSSSRPSLATSRLTPRIAQEEIFGPVLAMIRAKDFDDALAHRQRHRIRPDRLCVQPEPRASGTRAARVSRRQPVLQPQMHGRAGRRAPLRRLQHVAARTVKPAVRITCCFSRRPSPSRRSCSPSGYLTPGAKAPG